MSNVEAITDVIAVGTLLKNTLEEEFIALSEKNLEHLESVQIKKVELLQQLEGTWPSGDAEALKQALAPLVGMVERVLLEYPGFSCDRQEH